MNEINIKHLFRHFQKYFFYRFLDESGLFIGEKPEKKIRRSAVILWLSKCKIIIVYAKVLKHAHFDSFGS
jgi:hypothetical protein